MLRIVPPLPSRYDGTIREDTRSPRTGRLLASREKVSQSIAQVRSDAGADPVIPGWGRASKISERTRATPKLQAWLAASGAPWKQYLGKPQLQPFAELEQVVVHDPEQVIVLAATAPGSSYPADLDYRIANQYLRRTNWVWWIGVMPINLCRLMWGGARFDSSAGTVVPDDMIAAAARPAAERNEQEKVLAASYAAINGGIGLDFDTPPPSGYYRLVLVTGPHDPFVPHVGYDPTLAWVPTPQQRTYEFVTRLAGLIGDSTKKAFGSLVKWG